MTSAQTFFIPDSNKSIKITLSLLILGFLLIYILPLGFRPLVIPDESRYAEIPREMIATGDWTVPRLNGLRYFEKPVLGYWLNAMSIQSFGENAFAARFPSAMATGLTALIIFLAVAFFTREAGTGLLAAIIFLTGLEVFCLGVVSTLDSMVAFFLAGAVGAFYAAWHNRTCRVKFYLFLLVSGLSCGLACLTKGFLGLAVPLLTIFPFLLWQRERKTAVTVTFSLIGLALLVMLPWGLAIHVREPDFWNFFFWNEHIRRFLSDNAQHDQPFFYFFLVLPLGFFPWTVLVPAAVAGHRFKATTSPFLQFILCWLIFPFLFFSISSGKLSTYILPCFPPLSILTAAGLIKYFDSSGGILYNYGLRLLSGMIIILSATVLLIQSGLLSKYAPPVETGKAVLLFTALVFFLGMLLACLKAIKPLKKISLFALAPLMLYFSSHFIMPGYIEKGKAPGRFLKQQASKINDQTVIVSTEDAVRAVCWFFKRNDVFVLSDGQGGELAYGLSRSDSVHRHLRFSQFRRFVTETRQFAPVALIIEEGKYRRRKKELPDPACLVTSGKNGFVFAVYQPRQQNKDNP